MLAPAPDGVTVEVYPGGEFPSDPAGVEFWVPPSLSAARAAEVFARMPKLRVVQLLTAGVDVWLDRVPDGVVLCDGQGVHDASTSEWVVGATIASVRGFRRYVRAHERQEWDAAQTGMLAGRQVLVVGAGAIGEAICRRFRPFDVELVRVARRARHGVHAVEELPDLLPDADVVVMSVPLTAATRGMVDAAFLARMHDGALLVNVARGPVVDTGALVAELASGRLAAALDVTDPEPLPPGHPLWTVPNLFLTPHVAGSVTGFERTAYTLVRNQLNRFVSGEPLANIVTDGY